MQNSTTLNNSQRKSIRRGMLGTLRAWFTASAIEDDTLAYEDQALLADGQTMRVPRANLAAAKELLAARHAAERRLAERHEE
ncbi:MAG TPA: hypothetical protein VKQ36_13435 [Ktedonobacterales bacterium]|nr:hypothetical protein [Ktedonobacterales bacterium]